MSRAADITISGDAHNVVITGKGVLDLTNSQVFREGLQRAAETAESVIVDLRGATFIDTAMLEYLARARAAVQSGNRHLKILVSSDSHPLYVLNTVGFTELMDVEVYPQSSEDTPTAP